MRKSSLSHLLTIAILGFSGSLASSALAEPAEIKSPDVYQNVGILLNEVEQIRLVLGQRLPRSRTFGLEDVEPRQVFFQAQSHDRAIVGN